MQQISLPLAAAYAVFYFLPGPNILKGQQYEKLKPDHSTKTPTPIWREYYNSRQLVLTA